MILQPAYLIGITLQVIGRQGSWLKAAMYKNYLRFFDTRALLGLGDWPEGTQGNLSMYWHERFQMQVPEELITLLFPFLPDLEATVAEMGKAANISVRAVPVMLRTLAVVLVQDALEVAELFSHQPVHVLLSDANHFQYVPTSPVTTWLILAPGLAM